MENQNAAINGVPKVIYNESGSETETTPLSDVTRDRNKEIVDAMRGSIAMLIPLVMIFTGSVYVDDCPKSPSIPIILIISGSALLVHTAIECFLQNYDCNTNILPKLKTISSTLKIVSVVGFIVLCTLVYSIYQPDYSENGSINYCNGTFYLVVFCFLTTIIIIAGLLMIADNCGYRLPSGDDF